MPENEELFDVFDETNTQYLGQVPRSQVHQTGAWHRSVNVILVNDAGEVLIQKRSATKKIFPNCWDLSVSPNHCHRLRELFSHIK